MKTIIGYLIVLVFLSACCSNDTQSEPKEVTTDNITTQDTEKNTEPTEKEEQTKMQITIEANGKTIVFELNDSQAAKDLYAQLPLKIEVENYSNDEKIFYPPKKLDTKNTSLADAKDGTLAYYALWGDVVMFYKDFGKASGLYELGKVVSGKEDIKELSGTIQINKSTNE